VSSIDQLRQLFRLPTPTQGATTAVPEPEPEPEVSPEPIGAQGPHPAKPLKRARIIGVRYYRIRTEAEVQELVERDRKAGRWCNDAGESILYGSYAHVDDVVAATLTFEVVKMTGNNPLHGWPSNWGKPVHIRCIETGRDFHADRKSIEVK